MVHRFKEIERIFALVKRANGLFRPRLLGEVKTGNHLFPIYGFVVGSEDVTKPTFGLFGGVHGLERIGTHLALYYMESLIAQLEWDSNLRDRVENGRLVSIPLVNPGGMFLKRRANPRGVDLNRNAPVEAIDPVPFLLGGHRFSKHMPWYRGKQSDGMELEAQVLVDFVQQEMFPSPCSMALDLHSGFGVNDRIWFPYAKSRAPFPDLELVDAFEKLLTASYPFHVYKVEPQSYNYTTHGDLWDYLYDAFDETTNVGKVFLPWTLEMGSWMWVRKNPRQVFSAWGPYNPIEPHRYRRIMRRHHILIDFFYRMTLNYHSWTRQK